MTLSLLSQANSLSGSHVRFGTKTKYSVLAADDSPIILKTMQRAVDVYNQSTEDIQLDLTLAENREQAQTILKAHLDNQNPVDILITDNSMPHMDEGIALSQFAQQLSQKPFVAMMSSDKIEDKAKAAGIQAFFSKGNPILKVLHSVLDKFQQNKNMPPSPTNNME